MECVSEAPKSLDTHHTEISFENPSQIDRIGNHRVYYMLYDYKPTSLSCANDASVVVVQCVEPSLSRSYSWIIAINNLSGLCFREHSPALDSTINRIANSQVLVQGMRPYSLQHITNNNTVSQNRICESMIL